MRKSNIHKRIQERMLLYLDGELEKGDEKKVRNHLSGCPECSRRLEIYRRLWKDVSGSKEDVPSQRLWNHIQARLGEIEKPRLFFSQWKEVITRYAFPVFMAVTVSLAVAAGAAIGSSGRPFFFESSADLRPHGAIEEEFGLNLFDIAPPGSLTEIFDGTGQTGPSRK